MEDGIIFIMKPSSLYGGDDLESNVTSQYNKAEAKSIIFADDEKQEANYGYVAFTETWKRNGNNNVYLGGTVRPSTGKEEWLAVLSSNELASIAGKNSTRHFQKMRKSDKDWRNPNNLQFSPSSLVGIMRNGQIPRNGIKGNPYNSGSPRQDEKKEVSKALMLTSNSANGGNGRINSSQSFIWNVPGNQSGGGLLLLSREQWKTLAQSMYSFQTTVIGGAQAWLKKLFRGDRTCFSNDMEDESSLRKWISVRYISKRKGKQADFKKRAPPERNGLLRKGNIRIEIRREWEHRKTQDEMTMPSFEDLLLEESLNIFHEGDMIKIRVTMFCKPELSSCSQLEIDLVQSFACETETGRCRRRIAKVLKRDLITDFNWEKGLTSSGIYFYIHSTHFEIPKIFPLEVENSLEKFRISNFQYELRLRFLCEDGHGQTATSACSFPIHIYGDLNLEEILAEADV